MLGNIAINNEFWKGNIVIEPYDDKQLGPNSYDVRLWKYIYRQRKDFYNGKGITQDTIWEKEYEEHNEGFWLMPSELILAATIEIIGGRNDISSYLRARSTVGRQGLSVCDSAGFGDVGFIDHWTLEIQNVSQFSLFLPIGIRIAQICFFRVEDCDLEYKGAYKQQGLWTPERMLPKLGKDRF